MQNTEATSYQKFKQASKNYILTFVLFSLGYIVLGGLLLGAPNTSKKVICYLLGIVAIVLGIVRIVSHFMQKDLERAFRSDIPVGVMLILAGVYLLVQGDAIWELLPVLLGFTVVFDSILKMQHAFDLKIAGFGPWLFGMVVSIITAILGILLVLGVFSGAVLIMYFGIVLVVDGIMNLVIITLVIIQTKKFKKKAATAVNNVKAAVTGEPVPTAKEARAAKKAAGGADEAIEITATELPTFDEEPAENSADAEAPKENSGSEE